jgi:hypothetical protein
VIKEGMKMKNRLGRTLLMGIVASLIHSGSDVQAAETLEIDQAVELRFQTRSGKKYTLQGSNDFNSWQTIGKAGYGNGGIQKRFVSVDDASENLKFFRLEVLEESNVGFAPVSIAGTRYILNTGGFPQTIDFRENGEAERASANGTSLAKFHYSKTDDDRAALELFEGMGRELYLIEYTGSEAGAFRLETYRGEQLDDVDVGTFTVQTAVSAPPVPGTVNAPPLPTAGQVGVAKSQLSGLSFVFHDGGEPIWLQFEDASSGRAIDDDDLVAFTYLIEPVNEVEQILRIDLDGEQKLEFHLAYSGECSGTYILRETEDGQLEDVDMGTFSVSSEPISVHHEDDDDNEGDHDGDDDDGEGDHDGDDDDGEGDHDGDDDDNEGDHDGDDDDGEGDHDGDDDDGEGDHDGDDDDGEENGGTFSIENEGGDQNENGEKDVYPLVAVLSGTTQSEKLQGFESDDNVTGGGGSDLFPLTTGDDLITDFDPNEDMIDVGDFARASDGFGVLDSLAAIAANSREIVDERGVKALVIDVDGKLGDSTTTIVGVGIADLTEDNVFFGLGGASIPPLEFTHIAEFLVTYSNGDVILFPAHDLNRHPIEGQLISRGLGNN